MKSYTMQQARKHLRNKRQGVQDRIVARTADMQEVLDTLNSLKRESLDLWKELEYLREEECELASAIAKLNAVEKAL